MAQMGAGILITVNTLETIVVGHDGRLEYSIELEAVV